MKYAQIGSISSGTLRTEDLLSTFADELEYHIKRNPDVMDLDFVNEVERHLEAGENLPHDGGASAEWEEKGSDLVAALIDALNEFAPLYVYFGAHEGDGAEFGFWPDMDCVNELPRVEGSDEAMALGEDCVFVNDHGNVTVYSGSGNVIWDCV